MWITGNLRYRITEEIDLHRDICYIFGIMKEDLLKLEIIKKSIDARKKNMIYINFSVRGNIRENIIKDISLLEKYNFTIISMPQPEEIIRKRKFSSNPVIVGSGPSGIFAGLKLIEKGYKPLIIERGKKVNERVKDVKALWDYGKLNEESNVQFGEGGAGTFSDGKLVCRKNDARIGEILKILIDGGAPEEILYENKPHIGTDRLRSVITTIREKMEHLGAKFYFSSKMTGIKLKDRKTWGVHIGDSLYETDALILGTGHSSRDTNVSLFNSGVFLEPKSFAIGLRIEHDQSLINRNQFGKFADNPLLGQADYLLTYYDKETERGVYSFCMCPGGQIICASSEAGGLVVNGMSNYKRDSKKANSAIVVTVSKDDFYRSSPLDGMEFQREFEKKAYVMGGGNYKAPGETTLSFLGEKKGNIFPATYRPGLTDANLRCCLPDFLISPLKKGIKNFSNKIKGFEKSILIGIESRTSSPVRIVRDNVTRCSVNTEGFYPIGEGAGYAGGIISSALDGMITAELF